MPDTPVEQRYEQAKKFVEKNKRWRPQRRTVEYLTVMLAAMALSAFFVPRLLPGTVKTSEALVGHNGAISLVPLSGGPPREFVAAPAGSRGYSSWAISGSREEVIAGWYQRDGGRVEEVSIRSKSAFSGRQHAEWPIPVRAGDSRVRQLGFLPRHNQIWFLSGGKLRQIDIKSSQISDLPFRGPEGRGEIQAPDFVTCAAFSPVSGKLAYARKGGATVVTGLASGRNESSIRQRTVLVPGSTRDADGEVVEGRVRSMAWTGEDVLAVLVERPGFSRPTAVYLVTGIGGAARVRLAVEPPSGGRFTDISAAPSGSRFALLFEADPAAGLPDSVFVCGAGGRFSRKVELGPGSWSPPLSWGP